MSNTKYIKTNTRDGSDVCNDGKLGSLGYQKLPPVIYKNIRVNGIVMAVPVIQNLPDLSVVRGVKEIGEKNGVKWEIPDCSSSVVIYSLRDTDNNVLDSGSVECGETLELIAPDSTYTVELNGVEVETGNILSGGNKLIEITTTCDDASFSLRNSNNVELLNDTIPSGASQIIIAPDANVSLNSNPFLAIPSGGSEDITLKDQNNNAVTPINVSGNEIQVQAETKELFYRVSVLENDEDVTIVAKEIGTFSTITSTLTITLIEVNNVVVTLPFSTVPNDEIKLTFNAALTDADIEIGGTYA